MARSEHAIDPHPDWEKVPEIDRLRARDGFHCLPPYLHAEGIEKQDGAMTVPAVVSPTVSDNLIAVPRDHFNFARIFREIRSELLKLIAPIWMEFHSAAFGRNQTLRMRV